VNALLKYDAARRALAEAVAFDEVKGWADKAEALRVYARQAGDVQLEQDATEIRLRAVRRFGQLELELKAQGLMHQGGRPKAPETGTESEPVSEKVTLSDLGVDKRFSSNAQAVGGIAERAFEAMVERKRAEIARRGGRVGMDVVKEQRDAERRQAHQDRVFSGGKVEDLHKLIASGFKASTILADPPWHFMARSDKGEGRSASQHYTTDRLGEITSLPVRDLAAPDATLIMWMVDWCPKLAFEVIEAWGFAHKTAAFTWAKLTEGHDGSPRFDDVISDRDFHFGQGYWTRANPEDAWLATRGSPKRMNADVRQLIIHPVMEHSRKPDCVHDRVERLLEGPYLELYARRERRGWLTWGNEIEFKPPESVDPETGEITEAA
jgi:N6-adenosine-specific RNA methylase IME4